LLLFALLLFVLCGCETGVYHTVKPGQTLYRISKAYHVDEVYLARINRIHDPTRLKTGFRLYIPGAQRPLSVPVVSSNQALQSKPTPIKTQPIRSKPVKVVKQKSGKVLPQPQKIPSTSVKSLQWPQRGKIVRSFSSEAKTGGGKGIEIAVRSGSTVAAAAAGKVIYSGDGVNGYGYLIILQHENDLFTVYGFNHKNIVNQGDFVSRGEKIALSGTPPSGGQPRLHFEVRKGKQAVNPILYLP